MLRLMKVQNYIVLANTVCSDMLKNMETVISIVIHDAFHYTHEAWKTHTPANTTAPSFSTIPFPLIIENNFEED